MQIKITDPNIVTVMISFVLNDELLMRLRTADNFFPISDAPTL